MTNIIIACLMLTLISSCQTNTQATQHTNDKFYLVAHAGAGDPFWNIEFNGAKKAASELNMNVQIISPEIPNDIPRQVELLNAAIASKPRGIAISIPDDNAFAPSLKEAERQGIKVVAFNSEPNAGSRSKNPYSAFIGMDEVMAGKGLALKAYETGRLNGPVVVAMHQVGHVGLERRFLGIKQVLEEKGLSVTKLDITSDPTQAQQMLKGYLLKNRGVAAVFFLGPQGLHATGRMLHELYPDLMMASFDLTPLTLEMIKNGMVSFCIDQQPFMQGFMAITELSLAANYHLQPTSMNTGVGIVDQNNLGPLTKLVQQGVR
jgi:simple sugar transport system substrate-binding protein